MILCLDGPYGVGKTAVAKRIKEKLCDKDIVVLESDYYYQTWMKDNPFLFFGGGTTPQCNEKFVAMYRNVVKQHFTADDRLIISVMSLTDDVSRKRMVDEFIAEGYGVKHIVLMASKDIIRSRIKGDENRDQSFALQWLGFQLLYLQKTRAVVIDTGNKSIDEVADEIIGIIRSEA